MLLSVVIIAKNECCHIAECIKSAELLSNDIIVVDSGSHDNTNLIALKANASVHQINWQGYSHARNTGADHAKHEWIFALDADERISAHLAKTINNLNIINNQKIFGCKRRNYLGNRRVRYGEWGNDITYRLYNKIYTHWNEALVHETLSATPKQKLVLDGYIDHYTAESISEFKSKLEKYAQLQACSYLNRGKKATFLKRFFSPLVNFLSGYVFNLGFLDGYTGLQIANMNAYYTWLKYNLLYELQNKNPIIH